ncbi:MAG: lasso peptide biosynthesis B2 protein [Thermodesulfovibrionales bacterium]|jgi:hypothetical protein
MTKIGKFLSLPASDKKLLMQALFLLLFVKTGLHTVPFRTFDSFLNRLSSHKVKQAAPKDRILWSVNTAKRYLPFATCLVTALTCHFLLQRHRHNSSLKIGVRKNGDNILEAHAWIESEGRIVTGNIAGIENFIPLPSLGRKIP